MLLVAEIQRGCYAYIKLHSTHGTEKGSDVHANDNRLHCSSPDNIVMQARNDLKQINSRQKTVESLHRSGMDIQRDTIQRLREKHQDKAVPQLLKIMGLW